MRSISVRGPGRCDSWARCACRDVHAAAAFVMNGPTTTLVRKSLASQGLVGHHRRRLLASGAEPALSAPRPILKGPLAPGHFHAVTAFPDTSGSFVVDGPTTTYRSMDQPRHTDRREPGLRGG